MPKSCCVTRCTANKLKNPELNFYKLPNRKSQPLRRQKWIQAIRREASAGRMGKLWDPETEYVYVCSKHFVTGSKSDDESHPDYIPTLLPHKSVNKATSLLRLQNRSKRNLGVTTTALPTTENPPEPTPDLPDQPTTREERDEARRERDEAQQRCKFPHLTSIIDCFEIRIERPKKLKARAKTYSNYKKWTTAKYLIACHPSGCITFLSKGWGCRASDVHIVRQSGFLSSSYHKPGDQILADRGFTLLEDFAVLGAHLVMPAFTRGRKQLPGKEVEESRVKSNIRIHIERVIGVLKGRFHILDGPIPMRLVKSLMDERQNKEEATIDKIVHVCAALVNMSSSVVS
ncbi:hypothetical protein PO909_014610 [Leuciscus waleckii]